MRWQALFDDLEAQAATLARAERAAEVEERTRLEVAALSIAQRLRPALGRSLRLIADGSVQVHGTLCHVGADWVLLDEGAGREVVVATSAVSQVIGLGPLAASGPPGGLDERMTMRLALRRIARDRSAVALHLRDGHVRFATIERVGADFVEVSVHAPGESRRPREPAGRLLVALAAVVAVRRAGVAPG